MVGGVGAVYLATVGGYSIVWVTTAYVSVTIGTLIWYWYTGLPDAAFEVTT